MSDIPKRGGFRAWWAEASRQLLEPFLYSAAIHAYRAGVALAAIGNKKARLLHRGLKESFRKIDSIDPVSDRYIWFHAASLGELEQGRPLIEQIRANYPQYKILLTFFSPSGYEVRKNFDGADIVCYLPFDTPRNARRFVEKVRPEMAVFIKYEIWRNYLNTLSRLNVPAFLISACFRKDQTFFKKSGAWYRAWLRWFSHIFVQDSGSRDLLSAFGFDNVTVAGDTRFDRVRQVAASAKDIPEIESFLNVSDNDASKPFVFMAGSSWEADEEIYSDWINSHSEVKAIVAPHEFSPERLRHLKSRFSNGAVLMTEMRDGVSLTGSPQVLIMDCFGLLSSAYRYCDVAYVGGGFGAGIHNLNEPAAHGVPVVFGPNHEKFLEAVDLKTLGAGFTVSSAESFERVLDRLYHDPVARDSAARFASEYISDNCGATARILSAIIPSPKK